MDNFCSGARWPSVLVAPEKVRFESVKRGAGAGACRVKEDVYEGLAVWADGYNKPHCLTWTSCLTSRSAFKLLSGLS